MAGARAPCGQPGQGRSPSALGDVSRVGDEPEPACQAGQQARIRSVKWLNPVIAPGPIRTMLSSNRFLIQYSLAQLVRPASHSALLNTSAQTRIGSASTPCRPRTSASTSLAATPRTPQLAPPGNFVRYSSTMSTPNPPSKQILVMVSIVWSETGMASLLLTRARACLGCVVFVGQGSGNFGS